MAVVISSGTSTVSSGSILTSPSILSAGEVWVRSGGKVVNANIYSSGHEYVYSGGLAESTTVSSSGILRVYSGGTASFATVYNGGSAVFSSGATGSAIKENGGYVTVRDGANVRFLANTFSANITQEATAHSGTNVSSAAIYGGGKLHVLSGGLANYVFVNSAGTVNVSSGGSAFSVTVNNSGTLYVGSGGEASSTKINAAGGAMTIYSGARASRTTVSGALSVSGGSALETTLNYNGRLLVYSGGMVSRTTVSSGGVMNVSSGGLASHTTVFGSMAVTSRGIAKNVEVLSTGYLSVASGGKITGNLAFRDSASVTVSSGGIFDFDISALSPSDTALVSGLSFVKGTPDYTLTVNSSQAYGMYYLATGATGFDKTISVVNSSGTTLGTLTVGSTATIGETDYKLNLDGGKLSLTIAHAVEIITGDVIGRSVDITANMLASSVNLYSSACLIVQSGGRAEYTAVYSNYSEITVWDGGVATYTTLNRDGLMTVSSGGVASQTTINAGGRMDVENGGRAAFMDVNGYLFVEAMGSISGTTVNNGAIVSQYGSSLDTTISSGGKVDLYYGYASATTILDGGLFSVSGGSALDVTMSGGSLYVDTLVSGLRMSGGSADVSGNVRSGTISGGTLQLADYRSATVFNVRGGEVNVGEHGYFNGTVTGTGVVSFGSAAELYGVVVEDGGKVTGSIQVNRGGLSFGTGGILDFDITTLDNNSGVLVTNYSLISGTPECTLTVSDSQSNGTYMLATSASGFDRTITVKSAAGTTLGTLTVDGALEYNGRSYTLALSGTLLTVTVDNSIFTGDLIDETKDIAFGMRASSVNILSSGVLNVYARGTAEVTTVNSGGVFNVNQGGIANDTVVNSCGSMYVGNGGHVVSTVINNTGALFVSMGGVAVSTTIAADGGYLCISSGGSAVDTLAEYSFLVYNGASASNTTVKGRGWMDLGGSSLNAIILSGGSLEIAEYESSAFASATTVCDGGRMIVGNGTVRGAMIIEGGVMDVSGGTVNDIGVESTGILNVSGVEATLVRVNNGGTVVVVGGGTVNGLSLIDGTADVNGTVNAGTIAGGTLRLADYGSGAQLYVEGGEVFTGEHGYFNGTITGIGVVRIGSAVEVYNTIVAEGGKITGSIQVNRGGLTFGEGGVLNFDISDIGPGNETLVTNYSLISGTPECTLTISTDAQADGTYYLASGAADFEQTITIANAYGDVYGTLSVGGESVLVGSQDYTLNLDDDGLLSVEVTGGGSEIITGDITGETVDVLDGMYASSVNLKSDGILNVYAGGSADITTVNSSGRLNLLGGTVYQVTVNDGGAMIVEEGLAENVETDGYFCVSAGGSIIGFTMSGGDADVIGTLEGGSIEDGTMRIYNPGMVTGLTVSSGTVIVDDGARFNGMILEGGVVRVGSASELSGVTVSSGGKVTGSINLNSEFVSISFLAGSILDFNISRLAPENDALVTNYSFLDGMPEFTLTVTDSQGNGTYNLATGVESFGWNISVMNTSDILLGLLMIGRTVTIGGSDYTLNLGDDGLLSVTVGPYTPPGPEPPSPTADWIFFNGDFNGDGCDTLAVETPETVGAQPASVTIYQNGEPWGLGLAMDYGWEVVGSGDFTGDGLDDFLRVNGEGYVVGEISNGNGTFSAQVLNLKSPGWDILGVGDFNGNGTDDVLIANPTGASETVGLLGYWESGATWTLINGYSAEWECVATGDYNGDGKCDMLWRNQFEGDGGLTYNAYCTWIVEDPVDWRMVSVANPTEWNFLCSGDFDGDKMNDIAMINDVGVVGIWGVNDGYLSSWSILSAVTSDWQLAGVADYNGDGTDDIAWANTDTGLVGYWQIENKELASWQNIVTLS